MKIFVTMPDDETRESFIPADVRHRLAEIAEVEYNTLTRQLNSDELREKLMGVNAVITGWGTGKLGKEVLDGNDTLKIIAHTGGTVSSIVDSYVYDKGIKILSGNNIYAESVAEAILAYALLGLRKIPHYLDVMKNNGWNAGARWEGLLDQTVGFVSFGMIPKHLVGMLKPFRAKIKVYSSHISDAELEKYNMEKATLEEVFSECKVISVHSAYNEKTHHMINKQILEKIPNGALFINTSRGGVIDEAALIEELRKERFTAVLDVYEKEPLPDNHPLRNMPNVYAVPHMGGPTYDRRKYVTLALADDIDGFVHGRPLKNEITRSYVSHMTKQ